MGSTAALELVIQLNDQASKGLDNVANKGGLISQAFSFATGGLITDGIEKIGGAVTGFFGDMMQQSKDNERGMAQLDAVLKSTGGSAGVTKEQVLNLVNSLSSAGGLSKAEDDSVLAGENMLLTFRGIGKDVFPQATQAMLDMATAMSNGATPSAEDLQAKAVLLGKALDDPKQGLTALTRVGVKFTDQQKEQIKALSDAGDKMGAQKIILEELGKEFGGSAAASMDTFDGKMAHLGGIFDNVKQSLGDKLMPVLSKALDFLGSPEVATAIQGLADFLVKGLSNAIDTVSNAVKIAWPYVKPFVDAIVGFVTSMQNGGDLGKSLGQLFNDLGSAISNAWSVVGPALGDLLGKIWAWVTDVKDGLPARLAEWATAIWNWVTNTKDGLLVKLQPIAEAIWKWVTDTRDGLPAKLAEWATALWKWITDTKDGLPPKLNPLIEAAWKWVTDTKDGLPARLGEWATALWTWITNTKDGLPAKLQPLIDGFLKWLTDTKDGMPKLLGDIAGALWTFLTDTTNGLPSKLYPMIQAFLKWLIDTKDGMPHLLADIAGAVWTFLTDTTSGLPAHLLPLIQAFLHWLVDAKNGLPSLLLDFAGVIWGWVSNLAKNALSQLVTVGANMLEGIKQGIRDGWGQFTSWLAGLMSSMINGILAQLGIHSPSTVMAEQVGTPLVQGIQAGWDRAMPALTSRVMDSMASLTNGLQANVNIRAGGGGTRSILPTDGLSGSGGLSLGGGGLHINGPITIHAGLGANGRDIASDFLDELNAQLALATRTRRGVL